MGIVTLYDILRDIVLNLSLRHRKAPADHNDQEVGLLPEEIEPGIRISDLGLDEVSLPGIFMELKARLDGRNVDLLNSLGPEKLRDFTLSQFLKALRESIIVAVHSPIVVYVDDEEENIFIFKRFFGKAFRLATFTDPEQAFAFIRSESSVRLVITDEVMPGLTGNALCSAIRRYKPFLKFILLTGNPSGDGDLMYNSLRQGRFHDFISKPLDLKRRGDEYITMIRSLVEEQE